MSSRSPPKFRAGYHRLKTTSGCLTCRRRRKKCDELKQICSGCTRNRLLCVWPSEYSRARRRLREVSRRRDHQAVRSENSSPLDFDGPLVRGSNPESLSVTAILLSHDIRTLILNYCMNYFLPLQVHQYPDIGPTDQSYLISMSLCSSPLMDALLACAALTFRPYSKVWQSFAIERYNRSVHDICLGIDDGSFTGEEDCLLATTMWLCVFENSRLESKCSTSTIHLGALSKLLELRDPMDRVQASQSALSFERVCVEYYIHHSATIMLFDSSAKPASELHDLQRKYRSCLASYEHAHFDLLQSPMLGAPYEIFTTIIEATKLARASRPGNLETLVSAQGLYDQLDQWQHQFDQGQNSKPNVLHGRLYMLAVRILLLKVLSDTNDISIDADINEVASQGLQQLLIQPLGGIFGKYWLWPLAIFGSIMTSTKDINLIRDKLDAITSRSNCSAITVVRYLLEQIWDRMFGLEECYYSVEGLTSLLDADNMERTYALLIS